jgi:hypothetical protein
LNHFSVFFKIPGPQPLEGEGSLKVETSGIQVLSSMGSPIFLPFFQIDGLEIGDYSFTLSFGEGKKLEISRLGTKMEEAVGLIEKNFFLACFNSLFLSEADLLGIFPAEIAFGGFSKMGKLAVFPRLILLFPGMERTMVLPIGLLEGIIFNPEDYSLLLKTTQGDIRLKKMGQKKEEMENSLRKAYEGCSFFLSDLLAKYLPDIDPLAGQGLTATLQKDGAIRRSLFEEVKHWERMLSLIPEEKRDYARTLLELSNPENTFFGLSYPPPFQRDLPYLSWVSVRRGDLLGFEVTTMEDFATYFFRIPGATEGEKENWVKSVHLFWPLVGFRREVLYKEEAELKDEELHSILLLSRILPIFTQMRENLVKRVVHSDLGEWEKQVKEVFKGNEPGKS